MKRKLVYLHCQSLRILELSLLLSIDNSIHNSKFKELVFIIVKEVSVLVKEVTKKYITL